VSGVYLPGHEAKGPRGSNSIPPRPAKNPFDPGAWPCGCGPEKLKCARSRTDTPGMFFPKRDPGSPDPRRFAALRSSLNAPVVATEEMPSGPARAVIVMGWDDEAQSVLEVRLRSVTTGRLVVYGFEGHLEDAGELETALEAALSFAESMGFLFDDDILSGDDMIGRETVVEAWEAFEEGRPPPRCGRGEPTGGLAEITQPDVESAEPVELTDLAPEGDPEAAAGALALELTSGWSPATDDVLDPDAPLESAPVPESTTPLSKFRGREEAAPEAVEPDPPAAEPRPAPKRTAVGRVPLVRRKAAATRERPSLLARILGAF